LKKALKKDRGLKKENIKKFNIDLMIASVAITEECVLISADAVYQELRQINPDLKLINWLSS
jgi:hypothetical protein